MTILVELDEYVLVLVLRNLGADDVFSVRKTCCALYRASQAKTLWLHILRTSVLEQKLLLPVPPPYVQDLLQRLSGRQVESLVVMMRKSSQLWARESSQIKKAVRLDLPQMIDWLKLVNGRWLLVASSDNFVSKLSCWDVSLTFRGLLTPVAECYLPARVNSGLVDVQANGDFSFAIGLDSSSAASAIHIFTLRYLPDGTLIFVELCRLPGLSYVQLLNDDHVVCGMRHGICLPHLMNWKTMAEYSFGDLPRPARTYLLIVIHGDLLLTFARNYLQVFSMPQQDQPLRCVKEETYPDNCYVVEAVSVARCDDQGSTAAETSSVALVTLVVLTNMGVRRLIVNLDTDFGAHTEMVTMSRSLSTPDLYYRLRASSSGSRIIWFFGDDLGSRGCEKRPKIMHSGLSPFDEDGYPLDTGRELLWDSSLPALWAYPQVDFEEGTGMLVVGNIFGELALVDYLGTSAVDIWSFWRNITETDRTINLHNAAPKEPISLNLPEWSPSFYRFHRDPPPFYAATAPWTTQPSIWQLDPAIPADKGYSTDWVNWLRWDEWQGLPGDLAWILEHSYGFLGRPRPLAYTIQPTAAFFEAGGIYFKLDTDDVDDRRLAHYRPEATLSDVFSGEETDRSRPITIHALWETPMNEWIRYEENTQHEDEREERNRWAEQEARGGRPPLGWLTMVDRRSLEPSKWEPDLDLDDDGNPCL